MKRVALAVLVAAFAAAAYAAPANATVTFEGVCEWDGEAWFGVPLRFVPQDMDWGFDSAAGTCTGLVNGQLLEDTPVTAEVDGQGSISCGVLGRSLGARFVADFVAIPGDTKLKGRLTLAAVAAQNALAVQGDEGGVATGRASFFGQNDQVAVVNGCLEGNSVRSLKVNVLVKTAGPVSG
ncbi:MAG TPA: hypothetical protein VF520_12185 [Thermoleophilaceae bacterium]